MFEKLAKHRANDAYNDGHRPPLHGPGKKGKKLRNTKQSVDLCTCPAVELMYIRTATKREKGKVRVAKEFGDAAMHGHGHLCNVQQREKLLENPVCNLRCNSSSLQKWGHPSFALIQWEPYV